MAWTPPMTFVGGTILTAAQLNTHLRDNENLLKTSIANDGRMQGELASFREAVSVLASASTITLNFAVTNAFAVTLTTPVAAISVVGLTAGKATPGTLRITQDGAGGHACTLPSTWRWDGGAVPTVTLTANRSTIVVLYSDDGVTIYASLFATNA